jgi:carbonic anhydrase
MSEQCTAELTQSRNLAWKEFQKGYKNIAFSIFRSDKKENHYQITLEKFLDCLDLKFGDVVTQTTPTRIKITCIDGRCQWENTRTICEDKNILDLELAGCGAQLSDEQLTRWCEYLMNWAKSNNIGEIDIFSHTGCGAAALGKENMVSNILQGLWKNSFETETSQMSDYECEINYRDRMMSELNKVKAKLNLDTHIRSKHQSSCDMQYIAGQPAALHPEYAVFFTDYMRLENLDRPHVCLSRMLHLGGIAAFGLTDIVNSNYDGQIRSDFYGALAAKIIQGDHGMGDDFILPFVFLAHDSVSIDKYKKLMYHLEQLLADTNFKQKYMFLVVDCQ